MTNINPKRRLRNPGALLCLLCAAALLTCKQVPDYCGKGQLCDPDRQFCFDGKTYDRCGGSSYNPLTNACDTVRNTVVARCPDGSIAATAAQCGGSYDTAAIGGKIWMKKNLNITTAANSWCYGENGQVATSYDANGNPAGLKTLTAAEIQANCAKYGRLYTWAAAKTACQTAGAGWRLPDSADWIQLINAVGGAETAGKKLKSTSGWDWNYEDNASGNGTDDYGFSALPGGACGFYGNIFGFAGAGQNGYWWTAVEYSRDNAIRLGTSYDYDFVLLRPWDKNLGFSVRCVKDGNGTSAAYPVTVSSAGTGSAGGGSYAAGTTVSISAGTAPTGQQFKNWTTTSGGVTFADPNSAATTFTMPANAVTVTANWEQASSGGGYTYDSVSIDGKLWMTKNMNVNTGNSWCFGNDESNCNRYGRLYDWNTAQTVCPSSWRLPTSTEMNDLGRSFNNGDANLHDLIISIGQFGSGYRDSNGNFVNINGDFVWWVNSNGGVGFGGRNSGASQFVVADADGNGNRLGNGFSARCVKDDAGTPPVTPAAYAVTVYAGTGAAGGGSYTAGTTVSISAGTAPSGKVFNNWTTSSAGVTFADPNSASTTFAMPANAVTVTAVFEDIKYAVTVSSAGTGSTGGGSYAAGATVSISAGTAPSGHVFKNWTAGGGVTLADPNNAATTFTMPANAVTVTANFEAIVVNNCTSAATCKSKEMPDGKIWMTENLNTVTVDSWCYGQGGFANINGNFKILSSSEIQAYCDKYGRLYTWAAAKSACPNGWRLPDTADWRRLVEAAGGMNTASGKLKSASGWNAYSGVSSTDEFGFSALPGGDRSDAFGNFSTIGQSGYWWSATGYGNGGAQLRIMNYNDDYMGEYAGVANDAYSVRCVLGGDGGTPTVTPTAYTVTVISAGTGSIGDGFYATGTTVTVRAGTAPTGQQFGNWTTASGGVTFADPNISITTFTMPGNAVTVTAVFEALEANNCTSAATCKSKEMPDGKIWMTENLNIATADSRCFGNNTANCDKYGRLYTWNAAMTVCPSGWRLPTRQEWQSLVDYAGGDNSAGKKLKARNGWNDNNNQSGGGTDDYGFSALPGGRRNSDGTFSDTGRFGYWWTATEYSSDVAYIRYIYYDRNSAGENGSDKSYARSVRCIQD